MLDCCVSIKKESVGRIVSAGEARAIYNDGWLRISLGIPCLWDKLYSRFQPILYYYIRNSLEVLDVSCDHCKATGQCDSPNPEASIT